MSPSFIAEISKLTRLEKLELARYLLDELIKDEREEEFELSDGQISNELKEKYGINVSLL